MSKSIISQIFKNLLQSGKRAQPVRVVGKDHLGNTYYEQEKEGNPPSRYYEPPQKNYDLFDRSVPAEWEGWLRFRREAPTPEEMERSMTKQKAIIAKAKEFEEKDEQDREEAITAGLVKASDKSLSKDKESIPFPTFAEYEKNPGELYARELKAKEKECK